MALADLANPIAAFLRAAAARDRVALLATLGADATIVDNGAEHRGEAAICAWLAGLADASVALRPISTRAGRTASVVSTPPREPVTSRVAGYTAWCFTVGHDSIRTVTVSDERGPDVPEPLATYVRATNGGQLEALVGTFADDAVVNDELREYWHKPVIAAWAAREIIAPRLTMFVQRVIVHYQQLIATAVVDGDFDKRGLPDPLVLTLYASIADERIVQLLILRNEADL
ncbi:MAG: hypothetical protein JWN44_3251 [Myxococcales bacterium]|nr:hypothetical protein [Myxococcales bacterium]